MVELARKNWPRGVQSYKRGKVLYWQGDPVESLFVIEGGAVKISSISTEGRIYAHGILGPGRLLGATDYFLDAIHETTAEVINKSSLWAIPANGFQRLLDREPVFSTTVMQELAREAKVHLSKARELSFLDVQ